MEYRMYGLVPYNISPIQQGIQFGHAVVEYGLKYGDTDEYQSWAKNDKTFIILNGGTTNNNENNLGTLNTHLKSLIENNILTATFHEPDLGGQLTAIVFLVDERVFNIRPFDKNDPEPTKYPSWDDYSYPLNGFIRYGEDKNPYNDWLTLMGGKQNEFLRNFLIDFNLA